MLFWSFILAFVLGILYYSLSPRTDMVQIHDKPVAETAVIGFVNAHQAAKNALYHFEENESGDRIIILDYVPQMSLVPATVSEVDKKELRLFDTQNPDTPGDKFGHITANVRNAATIGLGRVKLSDVHSFVACLKMDIDQATNQLKKEITFDCHPENTQNYVMTYMDHPAWWNADVRSKELWRSAILRRTKGSDECGVLYPRLSMDAPAVTGLPRYDSTSEYVLDNSRRYILSVPKEITAMMKSNLGTDNLNDILFCISSISSVVRNAQTRSQVKYKDVPETTEPEPTVP